MTKAARVRAHSNTERKQSTHKRNTSGLIPFKKGDPRINRKGRPKSIDQLRAMLLEFFSEPTKRGNSTQLYDMILLMTKSKERRVLLEYAFGKVPQPIVGGGDDGELVVKIIKASDAAGTDHQ